MREEGTLRAAAVSKMSGSTSAVQPKTCSQEGSQVSRSVNLSVFFDCLPVYLIPTSLGKFIFTVDDVLLLSHHATLSSIFFSFLLSTLFSTIHQCHLVLPSIPLTVVQLEPTVQVPVRGPIIPQLSVQRWTGRDYDFSGALDF